MGRIENKMGRMEKKNFQGGAGQTCAVSSLLQTGTNGPEPPVPFGNPVVREAVETVMIAIILAVLMRTFFLQAFYIPSSSMENTLQIGDRIVVNKYLYKFNKPERGDVVVFKFPRMPSKDFIKRLVALSGDSIRIGDGALWIDTHDGNGFVKIMEPYIKGIIEDGILRDGITRRALAEELTLGPDEYFVMGDNRENSEDSRYWGPLKDKYIKGKAIVVYWPFSRMKNLENKTGKTEIPGKDSRK